MSDTNELSKIKLNGSVYLIKDSSARNTMEVTTNKVTSINYSSTNTQYPTAACVFNSKSKVFRINHSTPKTGNGLFNSQANIVYFEDAEDDIITVDGIVLTPSIMHDGDIIVIENMGVPDRWYDGTNYGFYKLETGTAPVTDVKVGNTSVVDASGVANITVPTKVKDLTGDTISSITNPSSLAMTCTNRYNFAIRTNGGTLNLSLSMPPQSLLKTPLETIYLIVLSGGSSSNLVVNLPSTQFNMTGQSSFTLTPGQACEIVVTFWTSELATFNGGVSYA